MHRGCQICVICNSNSFHSFIFKLCIMIVHTFKICTSYFVYILELQRFTEIVSYRDTLSDDTRIVSWGHLTIRSRYSTCCYILEMNFENIWFCTKRILPFFPFNCSALISKPFPMHNTWYILFWNSVEQNQLTFENPADLNLNSLRLCM